MIPSGSTPAAPPADGPDLERPIRLKRTVVSRDLAKVFVPVVVAAVAVVGVAVSPGLAFVAIAIAFGLLWLLSVPGRPRRVFVSGLGALLIGYAFLGRGLAHAGAPPLYIGEVVLALGVLALVFGQPVFRLDATRFLVLGFMVWGALQTLPYVQRYGVDAFRDAVSWGYGFFALAIAALVRGPDLLRGVDRYRGLVAPFCVFIILSIALASVPWPAFPGSEVPFIFPKPGDTAVHMAGIAGFLLVGLYAAAPTRVPEILAWLLWLPPTIVMGVINRGGMGAVAMSGLAILFGRAPARVITPLFVVLIMLVTVVYIDPVVDLGVNRKVSVGQITENITSIFTSTNDPALEGTKGFRLRWWGKIVGYTIGGPYFWTGKGFGVNLADDDGFQVYADHSLRAPHNGHMDILARMGVPGLALWVGLNLAWAAAVISAMRRARTLGSRTWTAVLIWLLVYWAAMMVNASFDPYLQGPQGGVWYWAVIGAGLVAADVVRALPSARVHPRAPVLQPAPS